MVVNILPITKYDFVNVKGSSTLTIPVAQHIDVSQFRFATLVVRLHTLNLGATTSLAFKAISDGYTPEDPSKELIDTQTPLANITMNGAATTPVLKIMDLDATKMAGLVTIQIAVTQPASPVALDFICSIDLVLKN